MRITDLRVARLSKLVHVAVGVILGGDGRVLIAKRPSNVHQGGLWEFPGGKVEQGETLFDALSRELREELAIQVIATEPLIKIHHDYGDKIVLLDVHKVTEFSGDAKGNEGQPIEWVTPNRLAEYEFPAANLPILNAITLPSRMLITGEFSSEEEFFTRLERALDFGHSLIQLRLSEQNQLSELAVHAYERCQNKSAQLLVNTNPDIFNNQFAKYQMGLYLNSKNLMQCESRPISKNLLLGASCHNHSEIMHAQKIGVDFICVSPILPTQSHPGQLGMGWERFQHLLESAIVPAYALGGMKEPHLSIARDRGAQGIAAISEWW